VAFKFPFERILEVEICIKQVQILTSLITHIRFTALWTLSGITQVSQYQKGKTSLDFTEARDSEWQWHHLHLATDRPPPLSFYRPDILPDAQPTV